MKIEINKELFQWEKNRQVSVTLEENDPEISFIRFYNKVQGYSIPVPLVDGTAQIPNNFLKEALPITALACIGEKDEAKVFTRRQFRVLKQAKPADYYDNGDICEKELVFDGGEEL